MFESKDDARQGLSGPCLFLHDVNDRRGARSCVGNLAVARRALEVPAMNQEVPRERDGARSEAPPPDGVSARDFLAAISHDLKDPLAVIVLGAGSILRRTREKSTRRAAKLIIKSAA